MTRPSDILSNSFNSPQHDVNLRRVEHEFTQKQTVTLAELHRIYHAPYPLLKNAIKNKTLPPQLTVTSMTETECVCEACLQGKASLLPWKDVPIHSNLLSGEALHMDINFCSLVAFDGSVCTVVVVDEASRYLMINNQSTTGKSMEFLVDLCTYIQTQTSHKIKSINSDNEKAFLGIFKEYIKKNGIHTNFTLVGQSVQNRVAERAHQTMWKMARTNLIAANAPEELWPQAMAHGVYMRNHLPHTYLNRISTPHIVFFARHYHGLLLKEWGLLVFVTTEKVDRQNRAVAIGKPAMFVGYPSFITESYKGYLVYYPESNLFAFEHHVRFTTEMYTVKRPFQSMPFYTLNRDPYDSIWVNKDGESTLPVTTLNSPKIPPAKLKKGPGGKPVKYLNPLVDKSPQLLPPVRYNYFNCDSLFFRNVRDKLYHIADESEDELYSDVISIAGSDTSVFTDFDNDQEEWEDSRNHFAYNNTTNVYKTHLFVNAFNSDPGHHPTSSTPSKSHLKNPNSTLSIDGPKIPDQTKIPTTVPKSDKEAHTGPDSDFWLAGDKTEADAFLRNNVFEVVNDEGQNIVKSRILRSVKQHADGWCYPKSRLILLGYSQIYGIDYEATYAPTLSDVGLKIALSYACVLGLLATCYDFSTAFLNADLDVPVYIRPPSIFNIAKGKLLKILKAVYGLKQSPRLWSLLLMKTLSTILNLTQCSQEPCLFYEFHKEFIIIIYFWVDDLTIFCNRPSITKQVEETLGKAFKMTKLGPLKKFLKMNFLYTPGSRVEIDLTDYIDSSLIELGFENIPLSQIPLDAEFYSKCLSDRSPPVPLLQCQQAVGRLIYVGSRTRPDIMAHASMLASKMHNPTEYIWSQIKKLWGHLKLTRDKKLVLGTNKSYALTAFSDTDYAGDLSLCQSRGCTAIYLMGGCIYFSSDNLSRITGSSTISEYFQMHTTNECLIMIENYMADLQMVLPSPPTIYADNQSAIQMISSIHLTEKLRKLYTKYHIIRQRVQLGELIVRKVLTHDNVADIGSKPYIGVEKTKRFSNQLLNPGHYLNLATLRGDSTPIEVFHGSNRVQPSAPIKSNKAKQQKRKANLRYMVGEQPVTLNEIAPAYLSSLFL